MNHKKSKNISFGLVEKHLSELRKDEIISEEQLNQAIKIKKNTGKSLGDIFIKEGFVTEEKLLTFIGKQLQLNYVDVEHYAVEPKVINIIPFDFASKYNVIPLYEIENTLTLATADPINVDIADELNKLLDAKVDLVISTPEKISHAIKNNYGEEDFLEQNINELEDAEIIKEDPKEKEKEESLSKAAAEPGIAKMVNSIIWQSVSNRASDIHIDPSRESASIRVRIDGEMHEIKRIPKKYFVPILSRIKVMADMDIAQNRIPQDGGVRMSFGDREVELRIATYPTIHGESITMRILARQNQITSLENLGLMKNALDGVTSLLKKKHGIFLVTGPTGSGKSTTLYTLLSLIDAKEKHIISVEDPVEIDLARVNQAQINVKAGLTFPAALRSMLRHDPDVIMVGEIRDAETSQLAVRAAVTGHLVMSSLHTNDAMSSIARLVNLGVDPFLMATALEGILNQRLVRVICPNCKSFYTPSPEQLKEIGVASNQESIRFAKGEGCAKCNMTGFLGRIGIFEWLNITDTIREFIMQIASKGDMRGLSLNQGGKSLRADGYLKVSQGITTVEEVNKATHG